MSLGKLPDFLLNISGAVMVEDEKYSYRFASFRLYVGERQLFHKNTVIPLEPKVFDVLTALVEKSGHLVEKEELLDLVWADSVVEEASIARAVYTLRKVLGEGNKGGKFIETVAKKGYRFVADVEKVDEALPAKLSNANSAGAVAIPDVIRQDSARNSSIEPAINPPGNKTRFILLSVGFITAVFLLTVLSFDLWPESKSKNRPRSIAILPLTPINSTARDEIFEVGIADALILRLNSMKGFIIRPLSATRKYTEVDQDALAAGNQQKVDYVLSSNYQLANGRIRVTSQLFNVATGQIEETFKCEKETGDDFSMQDAVAREIGNKLHSFWGAAASGLASKRGTTNDDAYRLYLQGRSLTYNLAPSDAPKAIQRFEAAIRLDPSFARAYSGLAHAYVASGNLSGGIGDDYTNAKNAVRAALRLDSGLAEGFAVSGEMKFAIEWDVTGGEKELLRAIELDPNSDFVHERYASYLAARGRFDEALTESKTALEINPLSYTAQRDRGRILYLARRYDEAIAQFESVMDVYHDLGVYGGWLPLSYELKGDFAGAYSSFMKLQGKMNPELLAVLQNTYETSGWEGLRRKRFEMRLVNNQNSTNYYGLARQSAMIGEKELAFEYLNAAVENHQGQLQMTKVEPPFDVLRDDPRFDQILARVGLK